MTKSADVLVVGAGPAGLYCGLRLAESGVSVTILEALPELSDAPKAVTHMPIMYAEYKRAGIYDDMFAAAGSRHSSGAVAFRRTKDGEIVHSIPPIPGRPGPLVLAQNRFCEVLRRKFEAAQKGNPGAKLLMGHAVEGIEMPEGEDVKVTVRTADGEEKVFTATYLVGADGSNSRVRAACGIKYTGETLPYKLIAADVSFPLASSPSASGFEGASFMCDDEYYGIVAAMFEDDESKEDARAVWRVSCGFPVEMTDDGIAAAIPEKFGKMLPREASTDYKIEKYQPYKVHQMCVTEFRKGRALLVGDAAHLANPYSGQLLSCGLFDASSLGDVLSSIILKSAEPSTLLSAWATARKEIYTKVMDPLSRACFAAVKNSQVETIASRHPFLKAMMAAKEGKGKPPPSLATDVEALEGYVPFGEGVGVKVESDPKIQLVWGSEN